MADASLYSKPWAEIGSRFADAVRLSSHLIGNETSHRSYIAEISLESAYQASACVWPGAAGICPARNNWAKNRQAAPDSSRKRARGWAVLDRSRARGKVRICPQYCTEFASAS